MTGEKNRYKPLEKLWKLDDEQLKTPRHDELVLNLLTKDSLFERIPTIKKWFELINLSFQTDLELFKKEVEEFPTEKKRRELTECRYYSKKDIEETKNSMINNLEIKMELIPDVKILSESPVFSGPNNFLIGYWDVVVDLVSWLRPNAKNISNRQLELILNRIGPNTKNLFLKEEIPPKVFIEVKPDIRSFGATLRQIRTYQSYCGADETNTILYTNDTQFKEAFEGQGIKVVNP